MPTNQPTYEEKISIVARAKEMWERASADSKYGFEYNYMQHRQQLVMNYKPQNSQDALLRNLAETKYRINTLMSDIMLPERFDKGIKEMEINLQKMIDLIKEYKQGS